MSTIPSNDPQLDPWRERAPSAMTAEEATVPRLLGFVGIFFFFVAVFVRFAAQSERMQFVPRELGNLAGAIGLALLLFHAISDKDIAIRRTYTFVGFAWLVFGIVGVIWQRMAGVPVAFGAWILGLFFVLASLRHEDEMGWRDRVVHAIGGLGGILALVGLGYGSISAEFLLPLGMLCGVMGFAFLWAYIELLGSESEAGYRAARLVLLVGAIIFLVALARSALTNPFFEWGILKERPVPYFIPHGLLLMLAGAGYAALGLGLSSDTQFVVLTRRELNAYFFSPIAYLVLAAFAGMAWLLFWFFVNGLEQARSGRMIEVDMVQEPVIRMYLLQLIPIIVLIMLGIPVITMRLFSEEHRTGTYEVLMTIPVKEWMVVLSKFAAALFFYMLVWAPFGFNLIFFRIYGKQEFEFRPLLAFFLMQAFIGGGFIAMGVFFSSLTKNQIVAAVLTAVGIVGWLLLLFYKGSVQSKLGANQFPDPTLMTQLAILDHVSFFDAYRTTIGEGTVTPRYFLFFGSMMAFWLFGTVKVLESRKWM